MHVDFASVGNHEFDKGSAELLRIQNGGCHADGCDGPYALADGGTTDVYPGADFQYLSTNVVVDATGEPCSLRTGSRSSSPTPGGHPRRIHRRGPRGDADDRHADGRGRAHLPG